ncbi:MAG: hypothetical protein WD512_09530, partial [Candidatus Paceibacterota bacterium]
KDCQWEDLKYCRTICNIVSDLGAAADGEKLIIPCTHANIKNPEYLDLVLQYSQFMRTSEFPTDARKENGKIEGELTEWEKNFASNMSKNTLMEVVLVANYLEFNFMLEAMCLAMAGLLKDRKTEQMREDWGIVNDFTEEEERKIKEEHKFIEEAQERN